MSRSENVKSTMYSILPLKKYLTSFPTLVIQLHVILSLRLNIHFRYYSEYSERSERFTFQIPSFSYCFLSLLGLLLDFFVLHLKIQNLISVFFLLFLISVILLQRNSMEFQR